MSDLASLVGRLKGSFGAELMRLAPPGRGKPAQQVDLVYPGLRAA